MIELGPTGRQRLEYFGLWCGAQAVRRLPFFTLRHFANVLGAIAWLVDGRGRRVAEANLTSALGEMPAGRRSQIVRQSYQGFARTMLELLWAPNLTREVFEKYARVEGLDDDPESTGQPTIYFCLHASNFEWLSLALSYAKGPGIVITQNFKNPLLGGLFDRFRSSTGHTIIPQERAMIRMLKHLQGGGYFNMVVDLNLDPRESSVIIDQFDGLKACVTQMHSALALRVKARIVPAECLPQPDGTYRLIYHQPILFSSEHSSDEIAQRCWDVLEPGIRSRPESWLWSYKHWRFKPDNSSKERYPFYANRAVRFDKKLAAA
jgi:KDO2-lipid IV(A) lauroyltransferase